MRKPKYISGPINTIRLEGSVNGIKKILYVMMDYHRDLDKQTECENIFATNIKQLMVQSFLRTNNGDKKYDIFLEMYPAWLTKIKRYVLEDKQFYGENMVLTEKYIWSLENLFSRLIGHSPESDKISSPKEFPNIRLHYIDIREYSWNNINSNLGLVMESINGLNNDITNYKLVLIRDTILLVGSQLRSAYDLIFSNTSGKKPIKLFPTVPKSLEDFSKYTPADFIDKAREIFYKMTNRYKHEAVREPILKILNTTIKDHYETMFREIDLLLTTLDEYLKFDFDRMNIPFLFNPSSDVPKERLVDYAYGIPWDIKKDIVDRIQKMTMYVYQFYLNIGVLQVDIFFLRRFLDKDYITNAAVYAGAAHGSNYVFNLVKHFDFKITHASYSKHPIDKMNSLIKDMESFEYLQQYLFPPVLYQCSNLTDFPPFLE